MSNHVLVIAAHPDDEVLGCGGTLARHSANGDKVNLVFLADGVGSRVGDDFEAALSARRTSGRDSAQVLGAEEPVYLNFPDNRLDAVAMLDVVQEIERAVRDVQPSVVYTHHAGDLNVDHRICHQAVVTAFRPTPGQCVKSIYGFEIPSSTEWVSSSESQIFRPSHFVNISEYLESKVRAMRCYQMEMRHFPHPRSERAIDALARWRGATAGFSAAEAFTVIRQLW